MALDRVSITPEEDETLYRNMIKKRLFMLPTAKTQGNFRQEQQATHEIGRWEGPYDWPVVAVHATLMSNGKVLAFDSIGDLPTEDYPTQNYTRATVWDPKTNSHLNVNLSSGFNVFCSAHTNLVSGEVLIVGGNKNAQLDGLNKIHTFNPENNKWRLIGQMNSERWYPSVTSLPGGHVLITGGQPKINGSIKPDTPEIFQLNKKIKQLPGATSKIASYKVYYHWLKSDLDGNVAYLGPNKPIHVLSFEDKGKWSHKGERDTVNRSYGSYAMYNPEKVIVTGGNTYDNTSTIIDLKSYKFRKASSMHYQRRQHNLTLLPNGDVLATGGVENTSKLLVDIEKGVFAAEVWNPKSNTWTSLANMNVSRQYHSTALLLPDGRVLSAGGGICGDCKKYGYHAKNAEIYYPPYLFKKDGSGTLAERPKILTAIKKFGYSQNINLNVELKGKVKRINLIKFGGVTHSANMEQRFLPLEFKEKHLNEITFKSPKNNILAPEGFYLLFVLDERDVPSEGKIILLR